jgi:hypothetical protein
MAPRAAILSAFVLLGCFPPGEGVDPPSGRVYFPVGLAVDENQKFLYIVNSDFDLQYNAGTVQSWNLEALRRLVPHYCTSDADCVCADDPDTDEDESAECDETKSVCDLFVFGEAPDDEHTIDNRIDGTSAPSHWCVRPGRREEGELMAGAPCGVLRDQSNRDQSLYPGRCNFFSQFFRYGGKEPILPTDSAGNVVGRRSVKIGAFATDVLRKKLVLPLGWTVDGDLSKQRERLFIPVRGDATLHWIDVTDGELECGQGDNDGACDGTHRSGDDPDQENTRNSGRAAPEPFGLDADESGLTVLVTNQRSGAVSLFATPHTNTDTDALGNPVPHVEWSKGPRYVFQENGLPDRPIGVANLPLPLALPSSGRERLPGFLVTFRNAGTIFLLRVYDDAAADPARPYTRRYESEPILTNSSGIDSRGIAVDPFQRKAEEQVCLERFGVSEKCARAPDEPECVAVLDPESDAFALFQDCLERADATPLEVFVANRAPSSLILARSKPLVSDSVTSDLPSPHSTLPLDVGPSRVYVGQIKNEQGELERRVFTVCFDSRRIAIYDPERQRLEAEVVTGRGPQALAIDIGPDYAYAYVGHFLDSYVGVVDLDQRHHGQYAAMIATIADPVPPRASK